MRVVSVRAVTSKVRLFRLEPLSAETLRAPTAGSHIDIEVEVAGRKEWRAYSLINGPDQKTFYEIAVQREDAGRGGSRYLHQAVNANAIVKVREPRNNFPLSDGADRYLLIAGGIGVTPIYAIARELVGGNADIRALYCARHKKDAAFADEFHALLGDRLEIHLDHGAADRFFDFSRVIGSRRPGEHLYMCGPNPMMTRVIRLCAEASWPSAAIHRETFDPTKGERDEPFVAHLARSGASVSVGAEMSLLDALIEAGHEPFYDCRRGECGLCVVDLLRGDAVHRDSFLAPEDRGSKICTCVSRAADSEITLNM